MFTLPLYKDNIMVTSWSDASSIRMKKSMAELMQQMRDPASIGGGSVGSIPQSIVSSSANSNDIHRALRGQGIHSTPASNLKLSEQMRNAQHDSSPTLNHHQNGTAISGAATGQQHGAQNRLSASKSYSGGLNHSASGGHMQNSNSVSSSLSSLPDISANNSQFFEVLYVGKIKVSHKRVPFTFIDDALPKFKAYDAQKIKQQLEATRKNEDATTGESETTQPAPVLNRISESNETAGAATADNKENTQPMAQAPDEGEVFRGRRVSQFDLPAKKIDGPSKEESDTGKPDDSECSKPSDIQRSVSHPPTQKDSKSSSDEE